MRRNLLRGEHGFTLPEVLVSMVVMATVLFALYALFDASVRVFGAGRDTLEAVQNARIGLSRLERELRAAYPLDRANGNTTLLAGFGPDHVIFGNDVHYDERKPNRRVLKPDGSWEAGEKISYRLNDSGVPVRNDVRLAAFATDIDGDDRAMTLEYFDANGDPVTSGGEEDVALVTIRLEISVDRAAGGSPAERTLQTSVALRNR